MPNALRYNYDLKEKRVYVAGHNGMVGRAVVKRLASEACEVLTVNRKDLDLTDGFAVQTWFLKNNPDCVINCAARVGGIGDNDAYPADFITDNILIQTHLIQAAHKNDVQRFVMLGSSCIYPKYAENPIKEDALLSGSLEPTNKAYAVAKISGIKMVQAYRKQYKRSYISLMPCNLYGPYDRFDLKRGHVMAALMMKAHAAKRDNSDFVVWGSGIPRREFMHVDDAADGILFALKHYDDYTPLNMGTGYDVTISDLAQKIAKTADYTGKIVYDRSKPDGTPKKMLDSSLMKAMSWFPSVNLDTGIRTTYDWYCNNVA